MLAYILHYPLLRSRILHFGIAVRPIPTRVQSIPRRAQVGPRSRIVAVFAESVGNAHLGIPYGLEEVNQVVLSRSLPSRLHDNRPVVEILQPQCCFSLRDVLSVVVEAVGQPVPLFHRGLGGWIGWVSTSAPDVVAKAIKCRLNFFEGIYF
jgi:hypothetical protein